MRFWTVQSQEVLQIIEKEDIYYPKPESVKLIFFITSLRKQTGVD